MFNVLPMKIYSLILQKLATFAMNTGMRMFVLQIIMQTKVIVECLCSK